MDGIAQATPRELRLFLSGQCKEKSPKRWLTTQLHLYGIPFNKSARVSDLKETLEKVLNAGKCAELAPSVAAVRDRLRREYDEAFKRLEDKLFAEIKGGYPEEANADPSRFVAKYFLDGQGRPDREKTKEPLSFRSWNHQEELVEAVEAVPGLAILKTWSTVLVGWEETMQRGIENEFARLESFFDRREEIHSAQANVDLKLFLKKYLDINLDGVGAASGARPLAPVTLDRWRLENQKLSEEIMSKAPGLHMEEFETNAVIGWDAANVAAEIARLKDESRRRQEQQEAEEQAEREKQEAEKKARWDRRCKGHYELVAKARGRPRPFGLQHLPGSYLVRWDGDSWRAEHYNDPFHDSDLMKLNIFPSKSSHGVIASFTLGLIEGTMLLAMSKQAVERLREAQPRHSWRSESEASDDDDDEASRDIKSKSKLTAQKRPLGDIADPWGVQAARAKRQKLTAPKDEGSHPLRVYFQFACNEVNGYPLVDDDNKHIGHFDFDETGLAAKGVFDLPTLGIKAQSISIFKVAEKPESDRELVPWYEFDGRSWGRW
ncbi:hypothetical protein C8A03DRAFT_17197 [Achaetomium macrosporum]|uniref:Uncharacterized protein n=1 Tax=Achaetomium macrosporum TaxID=79813 RepID=A0AAN7C847_9PEZI|nr:hypothetical protein C8A03DRAFT_17197 [Achaetomium macrosporum]